MGSSNLDHRALETMSGLLRTNPGQEGSLAGLKIRNSRMDQSMVETKEALLCVLRIDRRNKGLPESARLPIKITVR